MDVLDNAALGLKLRGVAKAERYEIARRFLALANLQGVDHKFPHELSGGMKQRVAIARTLANSPEVMLMDEPFAAVDAQTRMTLQEELGRIAMQSSITVVFITHSVEEAIFLGDRVALMTRGPGRIRTIVDVPFDRDARAWSLLNADPAFASLLEQLLDHVRSDASATSEPVWEKRIVERRCMLNASSPAGERRGNRRVMGGSPLRQRRVRCPSEVVATARGVPFPALSAAPQPLLSRRDVLAEVCSAPRGWGDDRLCRSRVAFQRSPSRRARRRRGRRRSGRGLGWERRGRQRKPLLVDVRKLR
jgi:energy-coupling factor transporter ATP-binding protein EcfA2